MLRLARVASWVLELACALHALQAAYRRGLAHGFAAGQAVERDRAAAE